MATSGELSVQIQECKRQIDECIEKIKETNKKLEDLLFVHDKFKKKQTVFLESFNKADARVTNVEAFTANSKVAKRYQDKMREVNYSKKDPAIERLQNSDAKLKNAVEKTDLAIEKLNKTLQELQARLSDLNHAYRAALANEESERAQQAAAEAAAASNRRK